MSAGSYTWDGWIKAPVSDSYFPFFIQGSMWANVIINGKSEDDTYWS